MDTEIIINGGEELSKYYPKNYELFQEKIQAIQAAAPASAGVTHV